MHSRRAFLFALAATGCSRRTGAGYPGYAFVANRAGKTVAAVDLSAFAVARHIALDDEPAAVYTHPSRPAVYAVAPSRGMLYEIHAADLALGRRIQLDASAEMARFTPSADALWLLAPAQRQFLRLPAGKDRPDLRTTLPATPADFDIALNETPSEGMAAVTLGESGILALVRLSTGRIEHTEQVGGNLGRIRFRKDGKVLLIGSLDQRQLIVYDVVQRRVAVRLDLAVRPDRFCMKPDGGQLYITGEGLDAMVTVYPYQTEVHSTMLAGRSPGFVAVSSQQEDPFVLVANPASGDVTILNLATQKVLAVAPVGKEPCFIAVTPNSEYALVLNRASGDIAVLRVAGLTAGRTRYAAVFTMIPVGSEPVSAVVRAV